MASKTNPLQKVKNKLNDESRYGKLVHGGYLNKRSKGKSWTKRYAVLWEDMALRFYEGEARGNVLGKIKMKYVNDIKKLDRQQALELNPDHPYFFSIMSSSLKKTWQFCCDEESRATEWVHVLREALKMLKQHKGSKPKQQQQQDATPNSPNNLSSQPLNSRSRMDSVQSSIQDLSGQSLSAAGILSVDDSFSRRRSNPVFGRSTIDEDHEQNDMEQRLIEENTNIVFEGTLDRKTNNKVLGRSLWEQRFFKLSTHSLSIYVNEKANIAESVIMLSSIVSVNRNTKNDGTDLKDNRFDITTRDHQVINLRTENPVVCQQWIHFLSFELKNHQKSIRTGLESLVESSAMGGGRRSAAISGPPPSEFDRSTIDENNKPSSMTKNPVKRFKRGRTSRTEMHPQKVDVIDPDEAEDIEEANASAGDPELNDEEKQSGDETGSAGTSEDTDGQKKHGRKLSIKSWAARLKAGSEDADSPGTPYDEAKGTLLKPESFEGFLIRKIGHQNDRIGEKFYFRLSHDTLEFSKVDGTINGKEDILKLHSAHILGSISVEHIKSVRMLSDDNEEEFIIVHNERDSKTDWILTTEKSEKGKAKEWVNVLQKAQREAKEIVTTIKQIRSDDEDDEEDSDSEDGPSPKRRRNKRGGQIAALHQMINDEITQDIIDERNHQMNSNGFEITSLRNNESPEDVQQPNSGLCSCLCFRRNVR